MSGMRVLTLLCFTGCVGATSLFSEAEKARPVSKVVNILKEMVSQLEKEAEEDEDVYQAMSCWCTTNDQAKTEAIAAGERKINDLTAAIEEATANSARLNTEIANLNKEVAKNGEALDSATALRKKQLAEFNAEEKDMLQSLTSLKSAIAAISKHHGASFLQTSESETTFKIARISASMQQLLHKHSDLVADILEPHQQQAMAAFMASPETVLLQQRQPQSGEIFGIMGAMKESFETNLAASQKEEKENAAAYEELRSAKESEVEAGQELIDTKTQELGDTDEKHATSTQDLADTTETLAADKKFLAELKEKCANVDQEYEERTKSRQLEIGAVSKALAFLNSDEAHALFSSTFSAASFVQTSSLATRAKAGRVLAAAARRSSDPQLAVLATEARTVAGPGGFGAVTEKIQVMVDALKVQQADEVKLKDFCIAELQQNDADTTSKKRDKADTEVMIEDITFEFDKLTKEIVALKAAIADAQLQMKHGGEDREKANAEFQQVVADQRATQKLLKAALDILKGFYDKAALVQSSGGLDQPAPAGFKASKKNEKSGGVMGMMQEIIDDAAKLEDEAIYGETTAQKDYEAFVVDTNALVDTMAQDLANKQEAAAKAEADKTQRVAELDSIEGELGYLAGSAKDLHKQCDYTIENFTTRQQARSDEMDALNQAIGIFSH